MKKNRFCYYFTILVLLFPLFVGAASVNSRVYSGTDRNLCLSSQYSDNSILTDNIAYLSQCMEATCRNNTYSFSNLTNSVAVCRNGNPNPYFALHKDGCIELQTTRCNNGIKKYCSKILAYDCNKDASGNMYTTRTTTRRTTRAVTNQTTQQTTTTTQAVLSSNSNLSSIELSVGKIDFNKDVHDYNLEVESTVDTISVTAVPEDGNSKVEVDGNSSLVNGSIIKINVTAQDGSKSVYSITINKKAEEKLSSNAYLKKLKIEDYSIVFNSRINDYTVIINPNVDKLVIDYETEDSTSIVSIDDNNNLSNGSIVSINVIAQDGTKNIYKIHVNVKKRSNFLKILFIFILILALLAGGYYIYKKIVINRSGDKYEYE